MLGRPEGKVNRNAKGSGLAWESLLRGGLDEVERHKIKKALLDYCGQDTLALVRLVEQLRTISN